ncbi:DNA/RNA non-specific endonuclease [Parabacteroides timonensis]|uniref:DNA/RNA non-specific endonuclease n=1 Tax=Parabacteroides timonensis TaxID=1871013 RepID=UPI00094E6DA0|nr:DNA/RNA non-specific endonuclease [Parabacteroides timonensis]
MRQIFILVIVLFVNFTLLAGPVKSGTKYAKKYWDELVELFGTRVKQMKTLPKTFRWDKYATTATKVNLRKTAKSQKSQLKLRRKKLADLTFKDLQEKKELKDKLLLKGYDKQLVDCIEELPLCNELSSAMIQFSDNNIMVGQLLNDLQNNALLLDHMNTTKKLDGYKLLYKTSFRTDVRKLDWLENLQRNSDKVSNAKKLKNKYSIENLQIEELDEVLIYKDGDKILAKEEGGIFYAWAGKKNEKGIVDKDNVNNFLNQNLCPNSIYWVDGRFKYSIDNRGRVFNAEAVLSEGNRGRNVDLQAIGRDGYGKNSGTNSHIDDGGHLFSQQIGGPVELINIVPQLKTENRGSFWKPLENKLSESLKAGKKVTLKIELKYDDDKGRPILFKVWYEIDGVREYMEIFN